MQSTEKVIANMNPFRYRSYYFDVETNLYYLQTRYYDPELGRFISADSIEYLDPETLGGLNLYAYCGNNPVLYGDPTGTFLTALLVGLIAGAIVGAFYGGITAHLNGQDVLSGVLMGMLSGAALGAIGAVGGLFITPVLTGAATIGSLSAAASIAIGTTVVAVGSFGVGLLADAGLQAINNNGKVDWGTAAWSGLQAAALNILNVFTAGTAGSLAEISASLTIGLAVNFLTGIIGLAIDLLRNPKYRGQYKYNLYDKGKFYAR